ncbi:hypothetical protein BDK51DRAFT_26144 [Blyttiomyces helicus]|uniref:Chromo domain-containing protein n=1 Tax=Blyttiomyces helicus TaxID=388810 RepID=A0A4P9W9C6_9FUNG|nr:hypothetical protein BDK51DRAFT_26144 [Blyttiomyces helicus]|eukprot:RKO88083.1 hypothetical protein BDK51DRAFT_26144 [Blyttiomyces helicus]
MACVLAGCGGAWAVGRKLPAIYVDEYWGGGQPDKARIMRRGCSMQSDASLSLVWESADAAPSFPSLPPPFHYLVVVFLKSFRLCPPLSHPSKKILMPKLKLIFKRRQPTPPASSSSDYGSPPPAPTTTTQPTPPCTVCTSRHRSATLICVACSLPYGVPCLPLDTIPAALTHPLEWECPTCESWGGLVVERLLETRRIDLVVPVNPGGKVSRRVVRGRRSGGPEVLVKFQQTSYVHLSWAPLPWVLKQRGGKRAHAAFKRTGRTACDLSWTRVERFLTVDSTSGAALVKWEGLGFEEATWESAADGVGIVGWQEARESYEGTVVGRQEGVEDGWGTEFLRRVGSALDNASETSILLTETCGIAPPYPTLAILPSQTLQTLLRALHLKAPQLRPSIIAGPAHALDALVANELPANDAVIIVAAEWAQDAVPKVVARVGNRFGRLVAAVEGDGVVGAEALGGVEAAERVAFVVAPPLIGTRKALTSTLEFLDPAALAGGYARVSTQSLLKVGKEWRRVEARAKRVIRYYSLRIAF